MSLFNRYRQSIWVISKISGVMLLLAIPLFFGFYVSAQESDPSPDLPEPYNLSDNEGTSQGAKLAIDGEGILHAVWWDNSLTGRSEVVHRQFAPDGKWSEVEVLTEAFELPFSTLYPMILPDGQFCAYWDGASVSADPDTIGIYRQCQSSGEWLERELVQKTRAGSQNFIGDFDSEGIFRFVDIINAGDLMFGEVELSDSLMLATDSQFVIDSNGIYHAAFTRLGEPMSVEYRFSNNKGVQWKEPERLTEDALINGGASPIRMVADDVGGVHIVINLGASGIFYRHWTSEAGWMPGVELTQGVDGSSTTSIGLAIDADGLAHVVWHGISLYYTQQNEDGTWTTPQILSGAIGVGPGPEIVIDEEGTRHVTWGSIDGRYDVFYMAF